MSFPDTSATLIRRLAAGTGETDWEQFFADYWGPLCGFATQWGRLPTPDAEDVASQVFLVLWESDLFARWQSSRAARLRTLLCGVARRLIANQSRVASGRKRILSELAALPKGQAPRWIIDELARPGEDVFYSAWAARLVHQTFDRLLLHCHGEGKGDYFRVLYGRLCERLTVREIANSLEIDVATAENYLKTSKARLRKALERAIRQHVMQYSDDQDDFEEEWNALLKHLETSGGIENAVREAYESLGSDSCSGGMSRLFKDTKARLIGEASIERSVE